MSAEEIKKVQATMDPRDRKIDFDLNKVDYEWVTAQTSKKELRKAYQALIDDGCFPDLAKHCLNRLKEVDPTFKTTEDFNNYTPEEAAAANDDVNSFLRDMTKMDGKIREGNTNIFGDANATNDYAEEVTMKQLAENERLKGNDSIKSKEFQEAIKYYSKSISIYGNDPAAYSNRALAYLRTKEFGKAIEDANTTLRLSPGYIKAYHRRGKAYAATGKYEQAIEDFQTILEREPNNEDINKSLKDARDKLNEKQEKNTPKVEEVTDDAENSDPNKNVTSAPAEKKPEPEQPKKAFKRIAIEEDSDDDEEEEEQENQDEKKAEEDVKKTSDESKPLIEEVSSQSKDNWWNKHETNYDQFNLEKKDESKNAQPPLSKAEQELKDRMDELEKRKEELLKHQAEQENLVSKAKDDYNNAKKDLNEAQAELDKQGDVVDNAMADLQKTPEMKEINRQRDLERSQSNQTIEQLESVTEEGETISTERTEDQIRAEEEMKKQMEKKEKQRAKVEAIFTEKVEKRKTEANALFHKGDYSGAAKIYKTAADILEVTQEDFPLFKKEVANLEAKLFNNIANCYSKDMFDKQVIDYSTKVIDRALYLTDVGLLTKAFIRRGLSYEKLEKYKLAVNDLTRVLELEPANRQAFTAIQKCQKYIQQDEGKSYKPNSEDVKLPELSEEQKQPAKPVVASTPAQPKPAAKVSEPVVEKKEEPKKQASPEKPKAQEKNKANEIMKEIEAKLVSFKNAGNDEFKKKHYASAIDQFTKGIDLYQSQKQSLVVSDIMKVTVLYTNRSLCYHLTNDQMRALDDADYVIENLDNKNAKALYRRAFALNSINRYEDAFRDYQRLTQLQAPNAQIKKEFEELKKKVEDHRSKYGMPADGPKIQEIPSQPAAEEPVSGGKKKKKNKKKKNKSKATAQNDADEDSDDAPEETKEQEAPRPSGKTKTIDAETLEKAKEVATKSATAQVLARVPKTAAGFEKDFNEIKKDSANVVQYLKKIPTTTVESIFKKSEVQAEILTSLLNAMKEAGCQTKDDSESMAKFLISLKKADNFDMTLMFIEDTDKKVAAEVCKAMRAQGVEKKMVDQIESTYTGN